MPKEALETQQPQQPQLPPAFIQARDQVRDARKSLLKDPAFAQPQQLRQFIAQFVLPLMEQQTVLFGSAFVETYMLAAADHEEIGRIHEALEDQGSGSGYGIDLDDLNDLQKAFFTLGSVIEGKGDPETKAAYGVCAAALTEFVGYVMDDARERDDDRNDEGDDDEAEDETVGVPSAEAP
jgi:hypothetical protein